MHSCTSLSPSHQAAQATPEASTVLPLSAAIQGQPGSAHAASSPHSGEPAYPASSPQASVPPALTIIVPEHDRTPSPSIYSECDNDELHCCSSPSREDHNHVSTAAVCGHENGVGSSQGINNNEEGTSGSDWEGTTACSGTIHSRTSPLSDADFVEQNTADETFVEHPNNTNASGASFIRLDPVSDSPSRLSFPAPTSNWNGRTSYPSPNLSSGNALRESNVVDTPTRLSTFPQRSPSQRSNGSHRTTASRRTNVSRRTAPPDVPNLNVHQIMANWRANNPAESEYAASIEGSIFQDQEPFDPLDVADLVSPHSLGCSEDETGEPERNDEQEPECESSSLHLRGADMENTQEPSNSALEVPGDRQMIQAQGSSLSAMGESHQQFNDQGVNPAPIAPRSGWRRILSARSSPTARHTVLPPTTQEFIRSSLGRPVSEGGMLSRPRGDGIVRENLSNPPSSVRSSPRLTLDEYAAASDGFPERVNQEEEGDYPSNFMNFEESSGGETPTLGTNRDTRSSEATAVTQTANNDTPELNQCTGQLYRPRSNAMRQGRAPWADSRRYGRINSELYNAGPASQSYDQPPLDTRTSYGSAGIHPSAVIRDPGEANPGPESQNYYMPPPDPRINYSNAIIRDPRAAATVPNSQDPYMPAPHNGTNYQHQILRNPQEYDPGPAMAPEDLARVRRRESSPPPAYHDVSPDADEQSHRAVDGADAETSRGGATREVLRHRRGTGNLRDHSFPAQPPPYEEGVEGEADQEQPEEAVDQGQQVGARNPPTRMRDTLRRLWREIRTRMLRRERGRRR